MASQKEEQLASLCKERNQLEQQLIQAKLDAATVKSQLLEERNKSLILKKQIKDQTKVASVQAASKGQIVGKTGSSTFEFLKALRQQQRRESSDGEEEKRAGSLSSQGRNNQYVENLLDQQLSHINKDAMKEDQRLG